MKIPEINPVKTIQTLGETPTPTAVVKERAKSTRDAGILILLALAGLATTCGYYGCRDKLKASEKKAEDAAALVQKNAKDASVGEAKSCGELLGRLATIKEIAACEKGWQAGVENTAKAILH